MVVKQMEANGGDLKRVQEELAREAYIMHSCKHPNIAQIYGRCCGPREWGHSHVVCGEREGFDCCQVSVLTLQSALCLSSDCVAHLPVQACHLSPAPAHLLL